MRFTRTLRKLWLTNALLALLYFSVVAPGDFMKSAILEFQNIEADPFDGTVMPIAYVPDWTRVAYMDKTLRYEDISVDSFQELPKYDPTVFEGTDPKSSAVTLARQVYIVPYMGSYRMNYTEYDGSHLGVDIRAPLGTPIRTIANGVVVKVQNVDTGMGKYVIVRHDDVPYEDVSQDLYSSYLHIEEAVVEVGQKVKKGDLIARVGMTGITTTPHLHLQIDRSTAPYHTYWPFTMKEAASEGLDFFGAINAGLGKGAAMRYTIHPMEFIQNPPSYAAITDSSSNNTVIRIDPVTAIEPPANLASIIDTPTSLLTEKEEPLLAAPPIASLSNNRRFRDVESGSTLEKNLMTLQARGLSLATSTTDFSPRSLLTRKDVFTWLSVLYAISPSVPNGALFYGDISLSDPIAPYMATAIRDGKLTGTSTFRPNDALTRAELMTLIARFSELSAPRPRIGYRDVLATSPHVSGIYSVMKRLGVRTVGYFYPEKPLTREEGVSFFARFLSVQ